GSRQVRGVERQLQTGIVLYTKREILDVQQVEINAPRDGAVFILSKPLHEVGIPLVIPSSKGPIMTHLIIRPVPRCFESMILPVASLESSWQPEHAKALRIGFDVLYCGFG